MARAGPVRRPSRRPPSVRRAPRAARHRGGPRRQGASGDSRQAIFTAAATAFARRGYDGIGVDDIARDAGVNKAMIYYHFADKQALYLEIVCAMLDDVGRTVNAVADGLQPPVDKLDAFIDALATRAGERPYFPSLMIREIADGAPRLDARALTLMRTVFTSFGRILGEGIAGGQFQAVSPVLAYLTIIGPLVLNAARERAGSGRAEWPMFVHVSHADLTRHMHLVARRMLQKD
jgi:AcrR family transcriptional regulator